MIKKHRPFINDTPYTIYARTVLYYDDRFPIKEQAEWLARRKLTNSLERLGVERHIHIEDRTTNDGQPVILAWAFAQDSVN